MVPTAIVGGCIVDIDYRVSLHGEEIVQGAIAVKEFSSFSHGDCITTVPSCEDGALAIRINSTVNLPYSVLSTYHDFSRLVLRYCF